MRLETHHRRTIIDAVRKQDPEARVILFGSRTNDLARGGDIDLLVISNRISLRDEWKIRRDILDAIGWQKLDLIVRRDNQLDSAIVGVAMESGIPL